MDTVKIYETDGECGNFTAKVCECKMHGDLYAITLDRTAFFPGGGGQSADTGTLGGRKLIEIHSDNDRHIIEHIISEPLEEGSYVEGCVDMEKRFSDMQNHTAEHIVSGTVHRLYGYDNVGFHMGSADITMDFNGTLDEAQLARVEELANKAVYADIPVKISFHKPSEMQNLNFRSKKSFDTEVRLVSIDNVDACACCAPHVSKTGEIGLIKILDFQKYKGGTRVYMLAGARALRELSECRARLKQASVLLSARLETVNDRIERLINENASVKYEKSALYEKYSALRAQAYIQMCGVCGAPVVLFEDNAQPDELRILVNAFKEKTDVLCAAFSRDASCPERYRFVIGCRDIQKLGAASEKIKKECGASCGGRGEMLQGSVAAEKEDIINALR